MYKPLSTLNNLALVLVACWIAGALAGAQDQDFSKVEMKVTKVAGNVYMLQGDGAGNIGASIGDDGIVIVDNQYAPLAEKIQAALRGITDKPVRFVINTHYHGDHSGGNANLEGKRPSSRRTMFANDWKVAALLATVDPCILTRSPRRAMLCQSSPLIMT